MLFHSAEFLVFLAAFLALLPLFKGEARIGYIGCASFVFYGWWYPPYLLLLLGLSTYAHVFGNRVALARRHLGWVVALGLLPLAVFKYTGFVFENLTLVTSAALPAAPDWALPIGISFITFTAIAYVVDGVRGDPHRARNFWHTALFIAFFPQLIAGPILRARELMDQVRDIRLDRTMLGAALLLFSLGVVKKVGVADQIAPFVDGVFSDTASLSAGRALLALYGFSVQIYCDFSGYTDMALALGLLLNVQLPANFDSPYGALSVRDFWRRWHMTLSRWLRDYLYIPLGGSRGGLVLTVCALLATMLLGGLWHGAAWTFVIWGLVHGVLIAVEHVGRAAGPTLARVPKALRWFLVFHAVTFAWVFFRAPSLDDALAVFAAVGTGAGLADIAAAPFILGLIVAVLALHRWDRLTKIVGASEKLPLAVVATFSLMLILIGAALSYNNPSAFIYFDF